MACRAGASVRPRRWRSTDSTRSTRASKARSNKASRKSSRIGRAAAYRPSGHGRHTQGEMSSDPADRLRRAYDAFNSGAGLDWSLIDPSIQHDQTKGLFLDGVFYGPEG